MRLIKERKLILSDISPLGPYSFQKILFYTLWAINISIFLGPGFKDTKSTSGLSYSYQECLTLKKVDSNTFAELIDSNLPICKPLYAITSSLQCITGQRGIISDVSSRGPPLYSA